MIKLSRITILRARCKQSVLIIRSLLSEMELYPLEPQDGQTSQQWNDAVQQRNKIYKTATEHAEILEGLVGKGFYVPANKG